MTRSVILVVEDEIVVAMEIEEKLKSLGYEVSALCSSGEEAVSRIQERRPDLVLMDIKLDGQLDGIQAAELIRSHHDIPIVYLTAYADEKTLDRAKQTEPFGYLVKPFSEAELHTTIEVALHKHRQEARTKESARWFESVINVLGSAMIVTDQDGIVRHINHVAETLTGWNLQDAVGKHFSQIYVLKDPETGELVDSPASVPLKMGFMSGTAPAILLSENGLEIRVEHTLLPITDREGNFSGVIVAFQEPVKQDGEIEDWFNHAANLYLTATLSYSEGDYVRAESFYKRTLLLFERYLGTDDPKVLNVVKDLAALYRKTGRHVEARKLEQRVSPDS